MNGIEGETHSYNGKDYTYKGLGNCEITRNDDGTVYYDIEIRDDVKVQILDGEKEVASVSGEKAFKIRIPNAKLWSVETPNLYTARVTFGEDVTEEIFGVRSLTWGNDGLKIPNSGSILRAYSAKSLLLA